MTQSRATAMMRDTGADAVAASVRRLIDAVARAGNNLEEPGGALAARIDESAKAIEDLALSKEERLNEIWTSDGYRRHDPCSGTENPLSPPLQLRQLSDGSLRGEVTLGLPYQGPPGSVHGGVSALLLDHAIGLSNARMGTPGVTAELSLRYLHPVPLFAEVTVTAQRTSVDGRKIRARGEVAVDGTVCVVATGLWMTTTTTTSVTPPMSAQ